MNSELSRRSSLDGRDRTRGFGGAPLGHAALWLGALILITAAMAAGRPSVDRSHATLVYLLLVLGASARAGRTMGLVLSVLAFLCLNFFFVRPYHTFVVAEPLDGLVIVAFLVTSIVAAQLLARARSEATVARARASEVDRLAVIGAEALNTGRAEEALASLAEVIRATLDVGLCEIYLRNDAHGSIQLLAASGAALAVDDPTGDLYPGTDGDGPRDLGSRRELRSLNGWPAPGAPYSSAATARRASRLRSVMNRLAPTERLARGSSSLMLV